MPEEEQKGIEGRTPVDLNRSREELAREVQDLRNQLGSLHERATQLNALISNVPGMVYRCRNVPDYPMVYLDGRVEDLTGYRQEDLLDQNGLIRYGDLIHPEDQGMVWEGVQKGVEEREDFEFEYRIVTLGGDERWVWERGRLIGMDADGTELLEGLIVDITQRKEAELALRTRRDFIYTVLENLPIGLGVNRMDDGKVLYVNPEFCRVYGWPEEDLPDVDSFFERVYPDPEKRRALQDQIMADIRSGNPERMRWEGAEVTWKDGSRHLVTAQNIPIPAQNLMISTAWDTTALIRTQLELREKVDLLRELTLHQESVREEEKLSIAREIHDVIGQSLTGAHLELTTLEEALESGKDLDVIGKIQEIQEFLQEILESSQNLATDLRPDMIDLMGLEATLNYYLPRAVKRAGLEWDLDVKLREEELDPQVSLTAYRLIQESVTNAIRHSGASRIHVILEAQQSKLLGTVRDNGRGITEAEANHPQAWGLVGMRERLLGLGGLLEIQGVPGKGTTVRMVIPLRSPTNTP